MSKRKKKLVVKESMPRFRTEGSFPALKSSTQTISLRLPQALLEELRAMANEREFRTRACSRSSWLSASRENGIGKHAVSPRSCFAFQTAGNQGPSAPIGITPMPSSLVYP
jgi:hypothetical protein